MRSLGLLLLLLVPAPGRGEARVQTQTRYEGSTYVTRGTVRLDVPLHTLTRVAGDFARYRTWALRRINGEGTDLDFITLIRDVRWWPGAAHGRGAFDVEFDVDLVWPVGSEGNLIRFGLQARGHPGGDPRRGVDHLRLGLFGENVLIDALSLSLWATGDERRCEVRFRSRVRFATLINPFMTMERYKKNVEWRIVQVIRNLKHHLESRPAPRP